jgi:hypothetical protein
MEDSMPKWMRDLFAGWPMIRANLPTFFVILVLIVGAIWIVVNWSYSALLASKNGQIELQDRQIGDYKAKQVSEPTKAPLLSPAPKEHPEFLKNVSFAWDSQLPLGLSGTFAVTKPKLRIYVDAASFSISMPGTNRFRAEIGSVADAVKGQNFAMQLIRFAKDDSGRAFWGDPKNNYPVESINRGRIVIIGPEGDEQHIYFELIRGPANQPFLIIREDQIDWMQQWKAEEN